MELQGIISKIDNNKEWHDRYCYFVPKFIESAISCEGWEDWDQTLFREYFERVVINVYRHYNKVISQQRKKIR